MDGGRDREAKQRVEPASMERSSCDAVASKDSTQRRLKGGRVQSLIDGRRGAPPSEDKEVHDRESKLWREESAAIRLKRLEREPNALHIAVASGGLDDVMFLLERGRSVQDRGDFGRPVLLEAATYGHVNVVHELTTKYGASIEDKNEFEQTALSLAAKYGHVQVVRNLITRGAVVDAKDKSGRTPLSLAATSGHLNVVQELLRGGADVDAMDDSGRTALMVTSEFGHVEVIRELIDGGVVVNAKDTCGRTALSYAAKWGKHEVVRALVQEGAIVDSRDENGVTALSFGANHGHVEVVQELIRNGATIEAMDNNGRSALWYAAQSESRAAAEVLLRSSVFDPERSSRSAAAVFAAAIIGDTSHFAALVNKGKSVDATINDGRTPLFYAIEFGHTGLVRKLIESGASVNRKLCSSYSLQEGETPLTLAGRTDQTEIFQALLEAGSSVNVRSRDSGETPLISIARWGDFGGVQALIARGGVLRFEDVAEDEYPLIPGTLKTMKHMCESSFEYESVCTRVTERLDNLCSLLQGQVTEGQTQVDALVSFASMLFRVCQLLFQIAERRSPLSRFIGSRAITRRVQNFHDEMDYFVQMLNSSHSRSDWKAQWNEDQLLLHKRFEELLRTDEDLLNGCTNDAQKLEAAVLIQYELESSARETMGSVQQGTKKVLDRFLDASGIEAPDVLSWFVSRDEVDFRSWNTVRPRKPEQPTALYEGKWRKTSVMIETSDLELDQFVKSASKWYKLSHPNVVKLFGACHIGSPRFFVYELVPGGKQLHEFLKKESNRVSTWKCLYEAALGLQYIHGQGGFHGNLRSENIIVGADLVAKLCVVSDKTLQLSTSYRNSMQWLAPERVGDASSASTASDIYALGMCIKEALTLQLPWGLKSTYAIRGCLRKGKFPERPKYVDVTWWELIRKMCAADPSERVTISYVVNRLKQLVLECKQAHFLVGVSRTSIDADEAHYLHLNVHIFEDLVGSTIPDALQYVSSECEKLPNDALWMKNNVYPALEFIFGQLKHLQKTPIDGVVQKYCAVLSRFQRYLRVALSKKSVYQLARSRKIAKSHRVVYSELEQLLNALEVSEMRWIRPWKGLESVVDKKDPGTADVRADVFGFDADESSDAVSLDHCNTPSAIYAHWTHEGLTTLATRPSWYISLRDLMFNKADQVGQGAFGIVYKGLWRDTPVVIKFMGYDEDIGTISTDLLLHEVRVWHRLNHPHVLKMYGACHVDKRYFVCEFASNGNFFDFLKKPGNEHLKWEKLYEAALGLEYLHGQNVAHNDLWHDNIMVGMYGKAKLIDFGLSCLLNEAEIHIDVKEMGAVNWRSPEYLAGGRPSFASDVYSFAMCIIEVISGKIPWGGPMSAAQIRFQLKKGNTPNLPDSTNEKQRNLIQLMTKFDPSERAKMSYVVDKLNEFAQEKRAVAQAS